jgi:hypothetical protein
MCTTRGGNGWDMTQDYNFCIVIGPRSNHANTNAYSKNPMGETKDIEDIEDEI